MLKKILFTAAAFLISATALSVTSAYALEPGCSPDMMKMLQTQSDAIRARNRAYAREAISRNESTLGLTCFDQAMRLSSRLGYIFSDNVPAAPPIQNTVVFATELAYPDWGARRLLALDLNDVISPLYDEQIKNFPPAVPPVLTGPPNALTTLTASLVPIIQQISDFQQTERDGPIAQITDLFEQIDALVSSAADQNELLNLINQVNELITTTESARLTAMEPLLAQLKELITGPGTEINCTRLDDLWTSGNPASSFAPTQGEYITGTPYYNLREFLGGTRDGASAIFLSELAPATPPMTSVSKTVIDQAWADLASFEPGGMDLWPATPTFAPTATTQEIIDSM